MDAKDVKPGRPSLLATTDRNATTPATSARILAGMESGDRGGYPVARKPRRWSWLLGGSAVVLLAGYFLMALPARDAPDVSGAAPASTEMPASSAADTPVLAAPDAEAMPAPFESLTTRTEESTEFPLPKASDATSSIKASPVKKPSSKTPVSRTAAGKRTTRAPTRSEPPLMASLLKNIEQDQVAANAARKPSQPQPEGAPEPAAPATVAPVAQERSGMDRLVQQIDSGNAVASADPEGARTQTVQAALRKCPRANTRAGLRCREKICSRFRGLDRACPD